MLLFFKSINISYGKESQRAIEISLADLIANPEQYDGKFIRVFGICNFEWEGNALYIGAEDYENRDSSKAIWLNTESNWKITAYYWLEKANGRSVLIEGMFIANDKGHLGLFKGAIKRVARIQSL